MGCDIHMYCEVRKDGKWVQHTGFISSYYEEGHEYWGKPEYLTSVHPYEGRNYNLFAWLADVRNYGNFPFPLITSEPRGLPSDMSDDVQKQWDEDWKWDGHSASFLSLVELMNYPYDNTVPTTVYMNGHMQQVFKETGELDNFWWAPPDGMELAEAWELDLLTDEELWKTKQYCKHDVDLKVTDLIGTGFVEKTIPALQAITENPSDVRVVFWFDN